jgi:hypothetical protein
LIFLCIATIVGLYFLLNMGLSYMIQMSEGSSSRAAWSWTTLFVLTIGVSLFLTLIVWTISMITVGTGVVLARYGPATLRGLAAALRVWVKASPKEAAVIGLLLVALLVVTSRFQALAASKDQEHAALSSALAESKSALDVTSAALALLKHRDEHAKQRIVAQRCNGFSEDSRALGAFLKCILVERYAVRHPPGDQTHFKTDLGLSDDDLLDLKDIVEAKLGLALDLDEKLFALEDATVAEAAEYLAGRLASRSGKVPEKVGKKAGETSASKRLSLSES